MPGALNPVDAAYPLIFITRARYPVGNLAAGIARDRNILEQIESLRVEPGNRNLIAGKLCFRCGIHKLDALAA